MSLSISVYSCLCVYVSVWICVAVAVWYLLSVYGSGIWQRYLVSVSVSGIGGTPITVCLCPFVHACVCGLYCLYICLAIFMSVSRQGFKRKKKKKYITEYSFKACTPPTPLIGKILKNDLYVMKRILYDMGHLKVAKWLLGDSLKLNIPFCPWS